MIKICRICGKTFETRKRELFCSPECRLENRCRLSRKKPVEVKCVYCGKIFETKTTAKKYCSDKCREASYEQRRYEKPLIKKRCEECGREFETRLSTQRYCSQQCAKVCNKPKSPLTLHPKTQGKSLDDWCREAADCNLDYGNYRALIESGKTFAELKARADSRPFQTHSHLRAGRKYS